MKLLALYFTMNGKDAGHSMSARLCTFLRDFDLFSNACIGWEVELWRSGSRALTVAVVHLRTNRSQAIPLGGIRRKGPKYQLVTEHRRVAG